MNRAKEGGTILRWILPCNAALSDGKLCGCFMPAYLRRKSQVGLSYCQTDWEQFANEHRNTANDGVYVEFREFFQRRPVSEWPVFGCGATDRVLVGQQSHMICQMLLFDHGKVSDEVVFLCDRPCPVIESIISTHWTSFSKALNKMTPQEFHDLLPPNYYSGFTQWSPAGYPGLPDIGYFPFDQDHPRMTYGAWGQMLMAVALKDLDKLAPVWAAGADMHSRPGYYYGRDQGDPTNAKDFNNVSKSNVMVARRVQRGLGQPLRYRSRSPERASGSRD